MQLSPNTSLQGGKYKIVRALGQGGFGITYEAEQVALHRRVAIKEFFMKEYCDRDSTTSHVTLGTSEGSKELVERFRLKFIREAQMIAGFDNPHIIRIYDIFEENGTAYYVMAFLDGGSLADKVKKEGPLSEERACNYIKQVGNALDYIHKRNVLHLDVKPSNILLNSSGEAVLIDFGISKHYDSDGGQTSTTPAGISKGYAPMEQYQQGNLSRFSPATDIYSLGATLFYLITGETPPEATEVYEDGLPEIKSSVSDAVKDAITKAMAPKRKDRPQSLDSFLLFLSSSNNQPNKQEITRESIDTIERDPFKEETVISQALKSQHVTEQTEIRGHNGVYKKELSVQSSTKDSNTKSLLWILLAGIVIVGVLLVIALSRNNNKNNAPSPNTDPTMVNAPTQTEVISGAPSLPNVTTGSLKVSSTPSRATIWIDGKDTRMLTPHTFENISIGKHEIKLVLDNFFDYSGSISISSGQRSDFSKTLISKKDPLGEQSQTKIREDGPSSSNVQNNRENTISETKTENSEIIPYSLVETKPTFLGRDAASFSQWVSEHLSYPEEARNHGVSGRVTVQFTVKSDGSVSDVSVVRGVDPLLDKEAIRVVRSSPKWTPGIHEGKRVSVIYQFPIIFQLK